MRMVIGTRSNSSNSAKHNSDSSDHNPLYTWANDEDFSNIQTRRYHVERLSLEEINEVAHLTELDYYLAMRKKDIKNAILSRAIVGVGGGSLMRSTLS
jgi:hypothetical protein